MLNDAKLDLTRIPIMSQKIQNFGPKPVEFIRHVAKLPDVTLGQGLPPSTDEILNILSTAKMQGKLTPQQLEFSDSLAHLRLDHGFQKLLQERIAVEQRPLSLSICCPTMPRDALGEHSPLTSIGVKVAEAATQLNNAYTNLSIPGHNGLYLRIFATPNYPGDDFKYTRDASALALERERLSAYTTPDLDKGHIGNLEFVYPNHIGFHQLWDRLNLPELKHSGKGTAMYVASLAVLARQFRDGVSDHNGFYSSMDTDLKLPASAYLAGFMHTALHDCVASIASFFRINSAGVETGRLNAVMTPFIEAVDYVLGDKLGVVSKVLKEVTYQLSGERQFRMDILKDVPIGGGYFDETSKNLHMASLVQNGKAEISQIANVLIGTYAHHNQPANVQELEEQGKTSGNTLEDMAREIFRGFFKAVIVEMDIRISDREINHIKNITEALGGLMISRKYDMAKELGLQKPNMQALQELLEFCSSIIVTEHQAITSDKRNGAISNASRLTLNDLLNRGMHPDDLFGEVNDILDRSKQGITPDELLPFVNSKN